MLVVEVKMFSKKQHATYKQLNVLKYVKELSILTMLHSVLMQYPVYYSTIVTLSLAALLFCYCYRHLYQAILFYFKLVLGSNTPHNHILLSPDVATWRLVTVNRHLLAYLYVCAVLILLMCEMCLYTTQLLGIATLIESHIMFVVDQSLMGLTNLIVINLACATYYAHGEVVWTNTQT